MYVTNEETTVLKIRDARGLAFLKGTVVSAAERRGGAR